MSNQIDLSKILSLNNDKIKQREYLLSLPDEQKSIILNLLNPPLILNILNALPPNNLDNVIRLLNKDTIYRIILSSTQLPRPDIISSFFNFLRDPNDKEKLVLVLKTKIPIQYRKNFSSLNVIPQYLISKFIEEPYEYIGVL